MSHSRSNTVKNLVAPAKVSAKVGSYVETDSRKMGEALLACDDWDEADFRYPSVCGPIACNVHVTGRTVQYRGGTRWVRCQVEFVGDGEPNTCVSGWILLGWNEDVNTAAIKYEEVA